MPWCVWTKEGTELFQNWLKYWLTPWKCIHLFWMSSFLKVESCITAFSGNNLLLYFYVVTNCKGNSWWNYSENSGAQLISLTLSIQTSHQHHHSSFLNLLMKYCVYEKWKARLFSDDKKPPCEDVFQLLISQHSDSSSLNGCLAGYLTWRHLLFICLLSDI